MQHSRCPQAAWGLSNLDVLTRCAHEEIAPILQICRQFRTHCAHEEVAPILQMCHNCNMNVLLAMIMLQY